MGSLFLSPGSWCAQGFVCALQESVSPVLGKFLQLYGGVNGDLLQEGLCHVQICCTQGPCLCGRPLQTHTSIESQALKERYGAVCVGSLGVHKVLFEPSNLLWWVWGLILSMILPLQPSCWDFFDLGDRISFFGAQSNILLLMVVQQWVVNLEFSQEKMNTCPSIPPSFNLSPASKQQLTELSFNESTQSHSALGSHHASAMQPSLWT